MTGAPTRGAPAARTTSLAVILLCLLGTLAVGLIMKAPCASGDWGDGRQYRLLCYTDLVPLYGTEHLEGERLPFLDPCPAAEGQCDEYPVLTMWVMRLAAWPADDATTFFALNAFVLAAAAVVTAAALYMAAGRRAFFFVAAPTLAIYAFTNWDLVAVTFATVGTLLYLRRRDAWSGVMLGLGAAAKLYPFLLVIPLVAGRFRRRNPDGGIHLAWAAAGAWLLINVPFAILASAGWFRFFSFNSGRPPDWDSLWFIGCHRITGDLNCPEGMTPLVNLGSALLFVGLAALVWHLRARRFPGFPRWTLGFPLIVLFLLTNKVYSPQYGLWLLPWFALALPDWRLFALFEAADVAVFATRFWWFGNFTDTGGFAEHIGFGAFEIAILARAVILAACVITWIRQPEPLPDDDDQPEAAVPAEPAVP